MRGGAVGELFGRIRLYSRDGHRGIFALIGELGKLRRGYWEYFA
jgi:hypothetical protein